MHMKFADGFWLNQRGYEVNYASQAYEITPVKNGLNVYATSQYIQNRGMTLGGPCLDITLLPHRRTLSRYLSSTTRALLTISPGSSLRKIRAILPRSPKRATAGSWFQAIQSLLSASSTGTFSTTIRIRD